MKILIINSGSSSIKYRLISMPEGENICRGMIEKIGTYDSEFHHYQADQYTHETLEIKDHKQALEYISGFITAKDSGIISSRDEIDAVGHRVVHGGIEFNSTTLINREVKDKIRSLFSLAPLHNPPNLTGIEIAEKLFPAAQQVAVFDTAFHRSIPPKAHRYAIPENFYTEDHIRVYGFHGTSHQYVTKTLRKLHPEQSDKIISIHLGNGCSMTAVHRGKSIDHSLGFGPMNGLIMGTRSGDIDQAVLLYLMETKGYTPQDMSGILQKKSGLLALTGMSDMRDIEKAAAQEDENALLALEMVTYRIRKYIGAYTAAMNGLDALIFTAGIGEHSPLIREKVCSDMDAFGIRIDKDKNRSAGKGIHAVEAPDSKVKIYVIPTDEELEIAREVYSLLNS